MATRDIKLLSLDGGGVRGLSLLLILRALMEQIAGPDATEIPKPCEYFDMIGGTSTGGLIAIMLGRLEMSVDQCIEAYTNLAKEVFHEDDRKSFPYGLSWKKGSLSLKVELKSRWDSKKLGDKIKAVITKANFEPEELLKGPETARCKVFVCAANEVGELVTFKSYRSPRANPYLQSVKIWEACRATSAAPKFFDPISIGPQGETFIDGALLYNNPVSVVWEQANDIWGRGGDSLQRRLKCIISIGTGVPELTRVESDAQQLIKVLKEKTVETEKTAEAFERKMAEFPGIQRYFRFNASQGLKGIGMDDAKKISEISSRTNSYIELQQTFRLLEQSAALLKEEEHCTPQAPGSEDTTRTRVGLQGVTWVDKFVPRPEEMKVMENCLLRQGQRRVFVLSGMGGIGKTQLALNFVHQHEKKFSHVFWLKANTEDDLRQSLASYSRSIPANQMSNPGAPLPSAEQEAERDSKQQQQQSMVARQVLDWLWQEHNCHWLLVFDNVDLNPEEETDVKRGAYSISDYIPAFKHYGAILITTRLPQLEGYAQGSKKLDTVDFEMSRKIFEKWSGKSIEADRFSKQLLGDQMLGGLPLAIAQAATYIKQRRVTLEEYIQLYREQWRLVMASSGGKQPLMDYSRAVGVTWSLSMEQVQERDKNASSLIRLWAFLDNSDLWHGLLAHAEDGPGFWAHDKTGEELGKWKKDWAWTDHPDWLRTLSNDAGAYLDAINLLLDYCLIDVGPGTGIGRSYRMHPVVHTWARQTQGEEEKLAGLNLAFGLFCTKTIAPHWSWDLKRRMLPHAHSCLRWAMAIKGTPPRKRAVLGSARSICGMARIGNFYLQVGQDRCCEAILEYALQAERMPWKARWRSLSALASIREGQGRPEEAEAQLQLAYEACREGDGEDGATTLNVSLDKSRLYLRRKMYSKAEETLLEILTQVAKAGEESKPRYNWVLTQVSTVLGVLCRQTDRLADAEKWLKQALEGKEISFDCIQACTELGRVYLLTGKTEEGESTLLQAFTAQQRFYGRRSPAGFQSEIGIEYARLGLFAQAEAKLEPILENTDVTVKNAIRGYLVLSYELRQRGESEKATAVLQKPREVAERVLGKEHSFTKAVYDSLNTYTGAQESRTK